MDSARKAAEGAVSGPLCLVPAPLFFPSKSFPPFLSPGPQPSESSVAVHRCRDEMFLGMPCSPYTD